MELEWDVEESDCVNRDPGVEIGQSERGVREKGELGGGGRGGGVSFYYIFLGVGMFYLDFIYFGLVAEGEKEGMLLFFIRKIWKGTGWRKTVGRG